MLKNLKPVSMLLLITTLPAGVMHAENLEANAFITQQNGACQGIVKDINGDPVIGASVVVKGTTNGVILMVNLFCRMLIKEQHWRFRLWDILPKRWSGMDIPLTWLCRRTPKPWMR